MNIQKALLPLLLLLVTIIGMAQNKEKELYIDYKLITKEDIWKVRTEVNANQEKCLSKTTRKLFSAVHGSDEVDTVYSYTHVYKDYVSNNMKFEDMMPNGAPVFVEEQMNLINWKLGKEEKEIMGYQCREARCTFRGRDYIAYFTTELPFKAAPWKFHGLPGVVLQVESTDEFLYLEAKTVRIQDAKEIVNPDRKENYMTWEEFVKMYAVKMKETHERFKSMMAAKSIEGKGGGLPRPEVIVEYNKKGLEEDHPIFKKRREEE